jgi:hypothetical protein
MRSRASSARVSKVIRHVFASRICARDSKR